MPRNRRPNPANVPPSPPRRVPSPESLSAIPTPMKGKANASIWNLKPMSATSQPVTDDPRLEPNTTHSADVKLSRPALTKPMAATVMAVEDWTRAVTRMPVSRP